jgi:hypothetical protein
VFHHTFRNDEEHTPLLENLFELAFATRQEEFNNLLNCISELVKRQSGTIQQIIMKLLNTSHNRDGLVLHISVVFFPALNVAHGSYALA